MLVLRKPYLLYLGDAVLKSDCKTAFGLRDWCREDVIGEWSHPDAKVTLDLPCLSPAEAARQGAGSIIVGVAPTGGVLPQHWQDDLEAALAAGLDVVSGLHTRLTSLPRLVRAAEKSGRRLVDVRSPAGTFPVGSGRKRTGRRVLTVGTDCALGKKYTALALTRALQAQGCGGDVPRDRPDRHHDCGQRHSDGCAGRGLSRRRGRGALARQRSGALGRDRRPGLAAPSRVRRGDPRPAARLPAGRDRAVPRPRPP